MNKMVCREFTIKCPNPKCDGEWVGHGVDFISAALDTVCPLCGYEIEDEDVFRDG